MLMESNPITVPKLLSIIVSIIAFASTLHAFKGMTNQTFAICERLVMRDFNQTALKATFIAPNICLMCYA